MKRFFLFFSAFTVLLSSFTVLFPSIANATSPYDNVLQIINPTELGVETSNQSFSTFDIGTWFSGTSSGAYCTEARFNAIKNALQDGSPYYISQAFAGSQKALVQIGVDTDNSGVTVEWNTNRVSAVGIDETAYILRRGEGNWLQCNGASNPVLSSPIGSPFSYSLAEYRGFNLDYPPDYAGQTLDPVAPELTKYFPEIGFHTTTDNELKAIYTGAQDICIPVGLTEETGCVTPTLHWAISDLDNNLIYDSFGDLFEPFSYKFPGNDEYIFSVGFDHPGPPFAPYLPDISLPSVIFRLNINGTFVAGGTDLQNCVDSPDGKDCGIPNPLEDCSTYGADIGGYFQCIINNFGIWLRNTLISLFVPKYSFYSSWQNDFGQFLNTKLGFVYTSFTFITSIFTGIISSGATGSCTIAPPGTLFGASFAINVCIFQDIVGNAVWGIVQGIVIGLTIIALCFASYRKYIEVVEHR